MYFRCRHEVILIGLLGIYTDVLVFYFCYLFVFIRSQNQRWVLQTVGDVV